MVPSNTMLSMILALLFSIAFSTSNLPRESFIQCIKNQACQSPKQISDAIFTPESSSYLTRLYAYFRNSRFNTTANRKPTAIIAAMDESHVQATVMCAKNHRLNLRIRSGGHDFEGLSYVANEPFVVLDMFNLRSIDVDVPNETAWVQAGATLGELYHSIAQKSKTHAFPGGVCFSVATGGHFIGGGYGNLMRKYGLSVDNIVDAQLVDVNGRILNRESMGEDLFWAIRGGGASFGVVLSWKIKLVSVPEVVTFFQVEKTVVGGATDLVYRWQEVANNLPEDIFIRLFFLSQSVSQKLTVKFVALYLGKSKALFLMMNQHFPELGLQQKDCTETSWVETTLYWESYPKGTPLSVLLDRKEHQTMAIKVKSDYVKTPIPKAALEELWKKTEETGVVMEWNPYGGRMSRISESETPFPHRTGFKFKIWYLFPMLGAENDDAAKDRKLEQSRKFYDFMAPYVSESPREAFFNYRDLDVGTNENGADASAFGAKYFKGNFERLMTVKTMVDPENFFRNEQSIPPLPVNKWIEPQGAHSEK